MDRHTNSGDGLISSTQIHCGTACPSSCSCASQDGIIFVQHEAIVVCPGEEIRPRKRIYKGLLCNNFIFAQRICRWISHLTMMVGGGWGRICKMTCLGENNRIYSGDHGMSFCIMSIGNQGSHLKLLVYRPIFLETDDHDRWHLTDGRDRSLYSRDHRWRIVARVEWVTRERPKICTIVWNLRTFAIFQFDMIVCWLIPLYLLIV